MIRTYTSLITASVLALSATTALVQSQSDSPRPGQSQSDSPRMGQSQSDSHNMGQNHAGSHRHSLQMAERLMQERSGLHGAIAIAEMHTKGIAIGVRLTSDLERITGQSRPSDQPQTRTGDQDRQSGQPQTRSGDQDRQTGQQQTRSGDQDRQTGQQRPLFAIVTCVADGTRVRDVVIDMATNTVVGVQTAEFRGSEQGDRDYSSPGQSSSMVAGGFARASDLMNATVRNQADKKLGDIDELAIDPDANRVVYGVLRRGGFLGIGESRYAVPSSALTPLQNGRIMLDLDESLFNNLSGFDNKSWPTQAEPKLRAGRSAESTDAPTARRVVKASDIIGEKVQCRDGHTVGEISDLIVEGRNGRVLYAIVKADRGHMPVPMSSLRKTDDTYSLPMAMEQLRSMQTLSSDRDPNWSDASWNQRIHESFGTRFETTSARDGR